MFNPPPEPGQVEVFVEKPLGWRGWFGGCGGAMFFFFRGEVCVFLMITGFMFLCFFFGFCLVGFML